MNKYTVNITAGKARYEEGGVLSYSFGVDTMEQVMSLLAESSHIVSWEVIDQRPSPTATQTRWTSAA